MTKKSFITPTALSNISQKIKQFIEHAANDKSLETIDPAMLKRIWTTAFLWNANNIADTSYTSKVSGYPGDQYKPFASLISNDVNLQKNIDSVNSKVSKLENANTDFTDLNFPVALQAIMERWYQFQDATDAEEEDAISILDSAPDMFSTTKPASEAFAAKLAYTPWYLYWLQSNQMEEMNATLTQKIIDLDRRLKKLE